MGGGSADATDAVGKAAKLAAGNSGAVAAEAAVQAPAGPSPLPPQPAAEVSASGPAQEQATPNDTAGTHTSPATGPSASSGLGRQRVSYSETFKQLQKLAGMSAAGLAHLALPLPNPTLPSALAVILAEVLCANLNSS
jgi:hypothetical protein